MKPKRPFKVRWFDSMWEEHRGSSFATRAGADFMAERMAEDGCRDVETWENDANGYCVPGSVRVFVDKAGRMMEPKA